MELKKRWKPNEEITKTLSDSHQHPNNYQTYEKLFRQTTNCDFFI